MQCQQLTACSATTALLLDAHDEVVCGDDPVQRHQQHQEDVGQYVLELRAAVLRRNEHMRKRATLSPQEGFGYAL